ncbi:MAG: hypothetical protein LBB90_08615 [Tannerella sp.]|jgi:hypothetical protein|nr:hypothetical protein [Tannerella sp.]
MKLKITLRILPALFAAISWLSCDQATHDTLSLHEVENNAVQLYYGSKGGVTITGGDGKYSFSCESPLLKAEMTHRNYILFEPLSVGDATVTIKDSSGEFYVLNVTITYRTEDCVISKLDVTVVGDAMTVAEQKELKAKALATIPVKAGGGYKFVYTGGDELDETEGIVFIYPEKYGQDGIEGVFERVIVWHEVRKYSHITYTLHYDHISRTYIFMQYDEPTTKTSPLEYVAFQFAEDLKEQYKIDYPNVEQVYTSQVFGSMTAE